MRGNFFWVCVCIVLLFALLLISSLYAFAQGSGSSDSGTVSPPSYSPPSYISPTPPQSDLPYELGVVLVQYDEATFQTRENQEEGSGTIAPLSAVNTFFTSKGYSPRVTDIFYDLRTEVVHIGDGVDPLQFMDGLVAISGVVLAQPSFLYEATSPVFGITPTNFELTGIWHLRVAKVYDAWRTLSAATDKTYVPKIGILDSGIYIAHPDFTGRIPRIENCKIRKKSTRRGTVFVTGDCVNGGYDFQDNDFNVSHELIDYDNFHGTVVASVAAANIGNGYAAGVAPFAHIIPVRVGKRPGDGKFNTGTIIKGLIFARLNNLDVVNISIGSHKICKRTFYNPAFWGALIPIGRAKFLEYQAIHKFPGVVTVSAGNNAARTGVQDSLHLPSNFSQTINNPDHHCNWEGLDNLIAVGGTERTNDVNSNGSIDLFENSLMATAGIEEVRWFNEARWRRLGFPVGRCEGCGSNYTSSLDIFAPGDDVVASYPTTSGIGNNKIITGHHRDTFSGTSVAAPQVAGVAALMLRANKDLSGAQIKTKILDSADELISLVGPDCESGTGDDLARWGRRLNAHAAVLSALGRSQTDIDAVRKVITPEEKKVCLPGGKDKDRDGLIEIATIEQLRNIRNNLAGTSYKNSPTAVGVITGCPVAGCNGYELINDLNFTTDPGGSVFHANGWTPISGLTGIFEGNDNSVKNLPTIHHVRYSSAPGKRDLLFTSDSLPRVRNVSVFVGEYLGCIPSTELGCTLAGSPHSRAPVSGTCTNPTHACSYTCSNRVWTAVRGCGPLKQPPPPVVGFCDNTVRNGCNPGTPNDSIFPDTATHYRWRCDGSSNGDDSGLCQLAKQATCTTPLSTLSTTATQEGTWASGCASVSRSGKYAQYYTFTLSAEKEVTIDLVSSQDTYLHLHTYSATAANHVGSRITFDDDGGENRNARIIRTLSAGTYTIEATTYSDSIVGSFTLTVTPTICTCTYSDWTPAATSKCSGTVAQTRTNTTVNACPGLSCTAVNGSVVATGSCPSGQTCSGGSCAFPPNSYAPNSYGPNSYSPNSYTPTPNSYSPNSYSSSSCGSWSGNYCANDGVRIRKWRQCGSSKEYATVQTCSNGCSGCGNSCCSSSTSPNSYSPNSYGPNSYSPNSYTPTPNSYGPNSYSPNSYTPTPNSYSPNSYSSSSCGSWSGNYCANDGVRIRKWRQCGSSKEYATVQTCSNGCSGCGNSCCSSSTSPNSYSPNSYGPNSYSPNSYGPNSYSSGGCGIDRGYCSGTDMYLRLNCITTFISHCRTCTETSSIHADCQGAYGGLGS